jgi:NAD(P)-dependent dehydrogenase (short-subunit alcohol dehydrogenase family)
LYQSGVSRHGAETERPHINISSVAALMGAALQPSYGATKASIIGLTKSLAIESRT